MYVIWKTEKRTKEKVINLVFEKILNEHSEPIIQLF